MKQNQKWAGRLSVIFLTGTCLFGGVLAAAGSQEDPLVTLSYITNTVTNQILEQVGARTAEKQAELEQKFEMEMNELLQSPPNGSYTVINLAMGQRLNMSAGCEVVLRVGSVRAQAEGGSAAFLDMTTGNTVAVGGTLLANHLYMAVTNTSSIAAAGESVTLLVRGGYQVPD